jgi:hypothetical protein
MIIDLVLIDIAPAIIWFLLRKYTKLSHHLLSILAVILIYLGVAIDGKITGAADPSCSDCGLVYVVYVAPIAFVYTLLAIILNTRWLVGMIRKRSH